MSEIHIIISSTGNFIINILATDCCKVCLFRWCYSCWANVKFCMLWASMLSPNAYIARHLPALDAALFVFTQEQRFSTGVNIQGLFKSGRSGSRDKNDVCFDVKVAKLHLLALGAEIIIITQEHSASRVPIRLLRLWFPLRLRPAVHRL